MPPIIEMQENASPTMEKMKRNVNWSKTHVSTYVYDGLYLCKQTKTTDEATGELRVINHKVCRRIRVLYLKNDLDTGRITVTIAFWFRDRDVIVDVTMSQLSYKEIPNLIQYGVYIDKGDEVKLSRFLSAQCQKAPMFNMHSYLGFRLIDGKPVYLHEKGIGIESTYEGNLPIQATGTYEDWYQFVCAEIITHIPALIPLVIGLSSLVLGFLSLFRPVLSGIVHFWGKHGTGKTTAEFIALSPFGLPSERSGLLLPWTSTPNALAGSLRNCFGLCFAFDDSSTAGTKDLSTILYTIANSQERMRMTKELKIRAPHAWAVNVVSSGEFDLLQFCQKTSGLEDRILRFQNLPITKDATHSDRIKSVLSHNYGFAAPMFAEYLMKLGIETVEETIQTIKAEISGKDGSEAISARHKEKIATILATAQFCADCFQFQIDYPMLERALLANEAEGRDERNPAQQAYEMVCDFAERNYKKFHHDKDRCTGTECYGKILYFSESDTSRVYFLPTVMEELLKKHGYLNPKQIYSEWRSMGVLYTNETKHLGVKDKAFGNKRLITVTIPYMVGIVTEDEENVTYPSPRDGAIDF